MPGWSVFVLAAPLFGLALTPPTLDGVPQDLAPRHFTLETPTTLTLGDTAAPPSDAGEEAPTSEATPEPSEAGAASPVPSVAPSTVPNPGDEQYTADVIRRRELGQIHRALGIATWIAMTLNVAIGFMQFHDLYGLGSPGQNGNPCASGNDVWLGECYGEPYAHIASATTASLLYGATFVLSLAMPDPNGAAEGNGVFAEHLRIHEVLRWIHSIGMLAQIVIGALLSNGVFGDRANNYNTLEIVADIHQAIGWTTWGALSAAAAVMLF